jgi:4-amino-4-deoxy-L-arabinose transferase-like glycosyltransferase
MRSGLRLTRRGDLAADRPLGGRHAAVPGVVWAITGLWGVLLIGASLIWPMTEGYDEPEHIDLAYVYSAHPFHFYGPGELGRTRASLAIEATTTGFPPRRSLAATPIPARSRRLSFGELGGATIVTGVQPNQMVQHPPLYYWTEAVLLRLPGVSDLAWDVQVWLMRLLSVLFVLPVPIVCWATARRLAPEPVGARWSPAVLAALLPLTVPNLIRDASSVTNDSLLVSATSVLVYLFSRVLGGDLSRRTATWVAVSLAAALLTKGFALALPPIVAAAYLAGGWRTGDDLRQRVRAVAAPIAVAAAGGLVGGLWWLRNVIVYGTVQIDGYGAAFERQLHGPATNTGTLHGFVPRFVRAFASGLWGGIGLPGSPVMSRFIVDGWPAAVLVGLLASLLLRRERGDRLKWVILFAVPLLAALIVAVGSLAGYRHFQVVAGAQGRYIYHSIVVIAALSAIGWARLVRPRVGAWFAPAVALAALLTNAVAWVLIVLSWYALPGPGSLSRVPEGVRSLLRWSPLPVPLTLLFTVVLPVVAGLSVMARLIRGAWRTGAVSGP